MKPCDIEVRFPADPDIHYVPSLCTLRCRLESREQVYEFAQALFCALLSLQGKDPAEHLESIKLAAEETLRLGFGAPGDDDYDFEDELGGDWSDVEDEIDDD